MQSFALGAVVIGCARASKIIRGGFMGWNFRPSRKRDFWKGTLAGACAGLAGTIAMTQFQNGWSKVAKALSTEQSSPGQSQQSDEDTTMKAAGKLAELVGHPLSFAEKRKAGPALHYAFGTVMGAVYGISRELSPRRVRRHPTLGGVVWGTGLFIGGDEIAVPTLGLSRGGQTPLSSHLYGLASHLVYGFTTGVLYSTFRKSL